MRLRLVVAYRGKGWRWPLGPDDTVEVWTDASEQVAEVSGALLAELIAYYLRGASLEATLRATLARLPLRRAESPPTPPPPRLRGAQARRLRGAS